MKNSIIIFLLLMILIFSGAIFAQAQSYPLAYTDSLDREILIEEKPKKIISLAPAVTEILYALGLENEIIGVSSACDYPQEALAKEKIGRIDEPNIEKIVALEPDLVIAESVTKIEKIKRLNQLGIKIIGFNPGSINDTIKMIADISYLTGTQKVGTAITTELAKDYQELQKLVSKKLKNNDRPRVFYQIWAEPLYTAGEGTFIDSLIHEAGGYNIARETEGSWPTYSAESLIAADPEVYISSKHSTLGKSTKANLFGKEIFRNVSAFKNDRLYIVDQDLVNRPSPRIIEGYKEIIKAIFPDLKKEME